MVRVIYGSKILAEANITTVYLNIFPFKFTDKRIYTATKCICINHRTLCVYKYIHIDVYLCMLRFLLRFAPGHTCTFPLFEKLVAVLNHKKKGSDIHFWYTYVKCTVGYICWNTTVLNYWCRMLKFPNTDRQYPHMQKWWCYSQLVNLLPDTSSNNWKIFPI